MHLTKRFSKTRALDGRRGTIVFPACKPCLAIRPLRQDTFSSFLLNGSSLCPPPPSPTFPPSSAQPSHLIQQPFVPAPPTLHRCTVYLPAFRKVSSFLVGSQLRGQRAEHSPLPRGLPPAMLSGAPETQCLALWGARCAPRQAGFPLQEEASPGGRDKRFCTQGCLGCAARGDLTSSEDPLTGSALSLPPPHPICPASLLNFLLTFQGRPGLSDLHPSRHPAPPAFSDCCCPVRSPPRQAKPVTPLYTTQMGLLKVRLHLS